MSAIKEVPSFSYPAYKYAQRLQTFFSVLEVDTGNAANIKKYGSAIIARLPNELLSCLPTKPTIDSLIESLTKFDSDRDTLSSAIASGGTNDGAPSIRFALKFTQLRPLVDPAVDDNGVRELSWATLNNEFPDQMKPILAVLEIKRFPSEMQLKRIDKVYFEVAKPGDSVCAASAVIESSYEKRISQLEESMTSLLSMQKQILDNQTTILQSQSTQNNFGQTGNYQRNDRGNYGQNRNNRSAPNSAGENFGRGRVYTRYSNFGPNYRGASNSDHLNW